MFNLFYGNVYCNAALISHSLLPLLPPGLLVVSVGIGVTSSIRPIFMPKRASALRAAYAPGPGCLVPTPILLYIISNLP